MTTLREVLTMVEREQLQEEIKTRQAEIERLHLLIIRLLLGGDDEEARAEARRLLEQRLSG